MNVETAQLLFNHGSLHRSVMLCGSLLYPGHIVLMFQRAISSGNFLVDLIML